MICILLTISSVLFSQVVCSSDYEVYHTDGSPSDLVDNHDDYSQGGDEKKEYDLSGFKRISPTPKFTLTHLYVSPESAERHFTRSHSKNGFNDGYSTFLQNNFDHSDDHDGEANSKYQQDDDEDDYDEDVNSKYQDDDDDDEEVNSKYQQAADDANDENDEQNYHNSYNNEERDRIQQKEESDLKQNPNNCKIIVKGKAMCKLCKDPVSGAHSESCSFSSTPPEEQYAYIKKEKYIA